MGKIYCIGEAFIDMYDDVPCVGGAPANVAACIAKLGGECAFIGGISTDDYGKLIYRTLADLGVDMTFAKLRSAPTAIARVTLENGERKFKFDRQNTADLALFQTDVRYIPFEAGDILHFCSNCLMDDAMRDLHARLIKNAKASGAIISYDVNLRPALWQDEQTMLETASNFLALADIVKVSEEEKRSLFKYYGEFIPVRDLPHILVGNIFDICSSASCFIETKGAEGACAFLAADVVNGLIDDLNILNVRAANRAPLDTTGAGDCFIGAVLEELAKRPLPYKRTDLGSAMKFASIAAALSVSRRGAIPSYPTRDEVAASKEL